MDRTQLIEKAKNLLSMLAWYDDIESIDFSSATNNDILSLINDIEKNTTEA